MATLTGNSVASTYKQLLKVTSEGIGADASAKYIEDGLGTDSALSISTTRVGIGTTSPSYTLDVSDDGTWASRITNSNSAEGKSALLVKTTSEHDGTMILGAYSGSSYKFKVQGDGNVGIGTDSPANKLVISDTASPKITVIDSDASNTAFMQADGTNGGYFGTLTNHDVRIAPNNSTKMIVKTSGNVGIGTTSPSTTLHTVGTIKATVAITCDDNFKAGYNNDGVAGSPDYTFNGDTNTGMYSSTADTLQFSTNSTERMRIDSSGNVGIGTASPVTSMHITGADGGGSGTFNGQLTLEDTAAYNATPVTGINFKTKYNTAGDVVPLAGITGAKENATDGNYAGYLALHTREAGYAAAERMRITSTGNVGIGIAAPSDYAASGNNLVVGGSGHEGITIVSGTANQGSLQFGDGTGTASYRGYVLYDQNVDAMAFGTSATERMRIDSAGNIGIGTDSPSSQDGSADNLVIEAASGNVGITIKTATTSVGAIHFSDGTSGADTYRGMIAYKHGDEEMRFRANAVQVMVIDANSRISLSNNDAGLYNTVFGKSAGNALASGGNANVHIGENSGLLNATGLDNVTIGISAMRNLPDGDQNTVIGSEAMLAQDATASGLKDVVAIGYRAFYGTGSGTTGANGTVAIGSSALKALTSGGKNVSIGFESGKLIQTGERNTILGHQAGIATVDVDSTVIIGNYAGAAVMTNAASGTVAIGKSTLSALTEGAGNTAVGYQAGQFTTTGLNNTFVGYLAGQGITGAKLTQNSNTAVGKSAGLLLQGAADGNTLIGASAGDVITTGTLNTLLGKGADPSSATGTNQSVIGAGTTGQADNSVTLGNASVTKIYMNQNGNGKVVLGTIEFDASQATLSTNANTLDDYEEGTFTPDINGTTPGTTTYAAGFPLGKYTKVGRVVHFNIYATWTGATGSGSLRINGLPFTAANDVHRTIVTMALTDYTIATSGDLVYGRINENLTNIVPQVVPSGGGSEGLTFDTTGTVFASGSYMV